MPDVTRYWARRPLEYNSAQLSRGQVLTLAGARNDEKLVRLGYVAELEHDATTYECAVCGASFVGISERTAHGNALHHDRVLDPQEEDARVDREERMLDQVAPLYLDKTKATQEAR